MGFALFVWVGGGLLKWVINFFGNEPSLDRNCLDQLFAFILVYQIDIAYAFLIRGRGLLSVGHSCCYL